MAANTTTRTTTNPTKTKDGAPPDWNTITVTLSVPNVQEACTFYQKIGFALEAGLPGPDGNLGWCLLQFGNSRIMVNSLGGPSPNPARAGAELKGPRGLGFGIYVFVPDVDVVHRALAKLGVTPDGAPREEYWGDRCFNVADPYGFYWTFATHIREVPPAEMAAAVASHN